MYFPAFAREGSTKSKINLLELAEVLYLRTVSEKVCCAALRAAYLEVMGTPGIFAERLELEKKAATEAALAAAATQPRACDLTPQAARERRRLATLRECFTSGFARAVAQAREVRLFVEMDLRPWRLCRRIFRRWRDGLRMFRRRVRAQGARAARRPRAAPAAAPTARDAQSRL